MLANGIKGKATHQLGQPSQRMNFPYWQLQSFTSNLSTSLQPLCFMLERWFRQQLTELSSVLTSPYFHIQSERKILSSKSDKHPSHLLHRSKKTSLTSHIPNTSKRPKNDTTTFEYPIYQFINITISLQQKTRKQNKPTKLKDISNRSFQKLFVK